MEQLENSLRIKVTGHCNRNCFFCHQEGDMRYIEDISFSEDLKRLADKLNKECNVQTIALTGGEPLLFRGLEEFVADIYQNTSIKKFSLTTNATIDKNKPFWENLRQHGLYKVNLSISDILECIPVSQDNVSVFKNQVNTIKILNEIGIQPTINVVAFYDHKYIINLINRLSEYTDLKFKIALLPDLTNSESFQHSQEVISGALSYFKFDEFKSVHRKGTSNTVREYRLNEKCNSCVAKTIQVKTTKPYGVPKWLHSMCDSCDKKDICQEGFYGMRVEKRSGITMVRLCLYKSTSDVLMTVDDFFESDVYQELKTLWSVS